MVKLAVVDHGAGNLVSIRQGLEEVGAEVEVVTTPDFGDADGVVLPGVGATAATMERLSAAGFVEPLRALTRPLLGVCVGMQVLFDTSAEDGAECLGIISGTVERLRDAPRLPHMGWNELRIVRPDPLLAGLGDQPLFYFVHSYAPLPLDPSVVVATASHGTPLVAAVRQRNVWGAQFHPERSGPAGLRLLANFTKEVQRAA